MKHSIHASVTDENRNVNNQLYDDLIIMNLIIFYYDKHQKYSYYLTCMWNIGAMGEISEIQASPFAISTSPLRQSTSPNIILILILFNFLFL